MSSSFGSNDKNDKPNRGNYKSINLNKGGNGNASNVKNNKDKNEKNINTSNIAPNTKTCLNANDATNNDFLLGDNVPMKEENNCIQNLLQCTKQVNIQLLLRRQKNYNNIFRNCYDSMKKYINDTNQINKGNFLWNLDGCCSIVNLWKNDYPQYKPQFSKEFKKEEVVKEIKHYIETCEEKKDTEHVKIFKKFYKLLNNERQDLEDDQNLLNYFPVVKPTENNVISSAQNLIEIQRRINNETETEEFYGFSNYDVDEKIRHLRTNGNSSQY